MDCYLCLSQTVTITAAGMCDECNRGVCLSPSKRRDHVVHGAQCQCGCRKTVCEADILDHAMRRHLSGAPGCFPGLAALVAAPLVGGIPGSQVPTVSPSNQWRIAATTFLNFVSPGRHALWEARETLGGRSWVRAPLVRDDTHPDVHLPAAFFSPARMTRVRMLAAATLAHGLGRLGIRSLASRMESPSWKILEQLLARQIPALGDLPQVRDDTLTAEHLAAFLNPYFQPTDRAFPINYLEVNFYQPATSEFAAAVLNVEDEEPETSGSGMAAG